MRLVFLVLSILLAVGGQQTLVANPIAKESAVGVPKSSGSMATNRERVRRINFSGNVKGREQKRHTFFAKAGQTISVHSRMASTTYYAVMPPLGKPGDQLNIDGESGNPAWEGKAPTSGRYMIEVYQRGKAKDAGLTTRYQLNVTVK